MFRRVGLLICLIAMALAAVPVARAALVWRPNEGWVDESTGSGLSASSSRDQLDVANKLFDANSYEAALKAYRILVRRWPISFFAPEAQFKIGMCEEKKGEFWAAYKAYQKMVQKYPASTFFQQALDREFAIGNLYLAGEPQRLWKIPMGPSMEKTAEIFETVIKAAPYGDHAPEAQFKIGLAHEKSKKWSEAVEAYTKILDKYPGNPIAGDAQYQIGYAWYSSASAADYDQSAADKAIEAFQDFIVRYPNSEKVEAAKGHMESLHGTQTQGSFNIAHFYEKQKNYKAAYIYYSDVVRQNSDSKQGQEARKKIDYLRPLVGQDSTGPTAGGAPVPLAPVPAPAPVPTPAPSPSAPPLPTAN